MPCLRLRDRCILLGSREAMEEEIPEYSLKVEHWGPVGPAALPEKCAQYDCGSLGRRERAIVDNGLLRPES